MSPFLLVRKPTTVTAESLSVELRRALVRDERVLTAVRSGPAGWDGVSVTEGKSVIELAVVATDKGHALDVLRHEAGASAAVFFGDVFTD